jgi:hypothetical protein
MAVDDDRRVAGLSGGASGEGQMTSVWQCADCGLSGPAWLPYRSTTDPERCILCANPRPIFPNRKAVKRDARV